MGRWQHCLCNSNCYNYGIINYYYHIEANYMCLVYGFCGVTFKFDVLKSLLYSSLWRGFFSTKMIQKFLIFWFIYSRYQTQWWVLTMPHSQFTICWRAQLRHSALTMKPSMISALIHWSCPDQPLLTSITWCQQLCLVWPPPSGFRVS